MDYNSLSLEKHKKYQGKLAVASKVPLDQQSDLATYYSPGVAAPCLEIQSSPEKAYDYTWKNNSVAVISDGSAVLGLGNIGGLAWLPVMEWKAVLFKKFADIDAIPLVLDSQDMQTTIETICNVAPTFGGINIEDIKAPQCFEILAEVQKRVDIPVFHDDQYGTAIVMLAWLINALSLVNKNIEDITIVISGAWAAGLAITRLLAHAWATNIIVLDSRGAIYPGRDNLNTYKEAIAHLNRDNKKGDLTQCIVGADVFIGVSQPDIMTADHVATMADKACVFATANPVPEIMPDVAKKAGAYIVASGRSDYPNQLNNILAFPGIFRWAIDGRISSLNYDHYIAAAHAIASCVDKPTPDKIVPWAMEPDTALVVAEAVKKVG